MVHRAAAGYGEISLIVQTLQATNLHIALADGVEKGRVKMVLPIIASCLLLRDLPNEGAIIITRNR